MSRLFGNEQLFYKNISPDTTENMPFSTTERGNRK